MSSYIHKSHNVTVLLYHLVFPAKYRRAVIDPEVDQVLRNVCLDIEARYEIKFLEIGTDKDHVHFLVQSVPMYSVKKIVQVIKRVVVQFKMRLQHWPEAPVLLRCQHRVPDSGRTSIFEVQPAEVELAFVDPAKQFDAGDHDHRRREPFEAEHRTNAKFHATVVLFDQVIQIFRRPHLGLRWQLAIGLHLAHGAMRRRVAVQCDGPRGRPLTLDSLAKKRLGRAHITMAAQAKVHGPSSAINGPVKVHPLATDLHIRLIDTPRWTRWPREPVPATFELRSIMVNPPHDGRVRHRQAALRHHLHQIAVAEFEPKIPPHAQDNDLLVEVAALEQLIQIQELGHHTAFGS